MSGQKNEAIVGAGDAEMDGKELPNVKQDPGLKSEECLNGGTTCTSVRVSSKRVQEIDFDRQEAEQEGYVEAINNTADDILSADSTHSNQSSLEADRGNVQHMTAETMSTEIGNKLSNKVEEVAVMDDQEVLKTNIEVEGSTERDQQENLSVCLDNNADNGDLAVPSTAEPMEIEKQITGAELSLHGLQDVEVEEQLVKAKTVEAIVGAEDVNMGGEEIPSAKQDSQFKLEDCLYEHTTRSPSQVNSNTVQEIEIDKQEAKQEGNVEAISNTADGILSADSRHSNQSSQEADRGNIQHMKAETVPTEVGSELSDKVEEVGLMDNQEVLETNVEVEESCERGQQENLSDCLDKKAVSDFDLVVPSTAEQMEIEKKVTGAEQLSSHGKQDVEVKEQLVKAETVEAIVGAEYADMDDKELPNTKQDSHLKLEECLYEGTTCSPAQGNANTVQEIELDKQEAKQQKGKVEAINNTADGILSLNPEVPSTSDFISQPEYLSMLGQKNEAIVGAGDADMDGKELPSVKHDPELKLEECLNEGTTCSAGQVYSNTVEEIELGKQEVEPEVGKIKANNNTADDILSTESRHSNNSSREADRGNVQHMKAETVPTEIGSELSDKVEEVATVDSQEVLKTNIEVKGSTERDQLENLSECLNKNGNDDFNLAVPSSVEQMEIEKQVTGAEQLSLHGQQDGVKELVKAETVYHSTKNHDDVCVGPESLSKTQVIIRAEDTTATAIEGMIPNEASNSSTLDNPQSCSGNDQNLKAEIVSENIDIHRQVMDGSEVGRVEGDKKGKAIESLDERTDHVFSDIDPSKGHNVKIDDEQAVYFEQFTLNEEQGMEVRKHVTDIEQPDNSSEEIVKEAPFKAESSVVHQASYQLPRGEEGEFFVSDLVWGKVRSHPWWPGQIFDPADASERAMKYHKKDCFLVAYFGDRTFAWNEASLLKPFRMHFSQIEKLSNSETFQNAVNCALEEVCRREELGLACSCMNDDVYDRIRFQIVENSGICLESSMRDGLDRLARANSFQPEKLVDYIKALAQSPSAGADSLELVIAKAHLLSFYRLKGYNELPEFQSRGTSLENDVNTPPVEDKMDLDGIIDHGARAYGDHEQNFFGQETLISKRSSYHRRKHNLKDYHSKKERSLSELMGDALDSPDVEIGPDEKASSRFMSTITGRKRKAVDSIDDESQHEGRKTISLAKVSMTAPNVPKPSFKIGECIRRAASQMTGSPSAILKSGSEKFLKVEGSSDGLVVDGSDVSLENSGDTLRKGTIMPTYYSSLDELLSQLHLAAEDPVRGYNFLNIIISFFSDFRNSVVVDQHSVDKTSGKRKRSSISNIGSSEAFEFEDMNDTYWTDRVIQNGSEEQQPTEKGGYQIVPVELGKQVQNQNQNQRTRRPYTRKRYSDSNIEPPPEKPPGYIDENAPAELVMNFSEMDTLPSETNLNKMFRHFGPIRESETEVDRETSRARVVFKKCSDAEVAYNSAGKFNIFGPMIVNYQLNYSISELFKISPVVMSLGDDETT